MPSISESPARRQLVQQQPEQEQDDEMASSICTNDIDDILDEAMDSEESEEPSQAAQSPSPRARRGSPLRRGLSPTQSAGSWEFQTPVAGGRPEHDFKTPLVEGITASPQRQLPEVEGSEGGKLLHTVSFYRKAKAAEAGGATPHAKITRNAGPAFTAEESEQVSGQKEKERIGAACRQ